MKTDLQPAYVLHARPWRESSALLEVLTPDYGRLGLLHQGARRNRSTVPQVFRHYNLSWRGKGELPVVRSLETGPAPPLKTPERQLCGLYINELVMRLVPRHSSSPVLFAHYQTALHGLAASGEVEAELRRFEVRLLQDIGYGLQLEFDAARREAVRPEAWYHYRVEQGPQYAAEQQAGSGRIRGRTLQAIEALDFSEAATLGESKALLRQVLDHHLQGRPLKTRDIMRYLSS